MQEFYFFALLDFNQRFKCYQFKRQLSYYVLTIYVPTFMTVRKRVENTETVRY